jgi:hypothetical protein
MSIELELNLAEGPHVDAHRFRGSFVVESPGENRGGPFAEAG